MLPMPGHDKQQYGPAVVPEAKVVEAVRVSAVVGVAVAVAAAAAVVAVAAAGYRGDEAA